MTTQMIKSSKDIDIKYELTTEQTHEVISKIRKRIQQYFRANKLSYAIFGKSEGLDSSVIAGLLTNLNGVKPIGVIMPCESDPDAERVARLVLEHFKIPWIRVNLTREFHCLMGAFYSADGVHGQLNKILCCNRDVDLLKAMPHRKARAAGNIKVRLRMITLYHIAQLTGGIVISTDNLSEFWMGFWTLNGDVGDLAPIQQIWKGLEEYAIAEALGVPKESIESVPTDGLDVIPGGTDEDQLGLPYRDLDRVIVALLQNKFDGNDECSEDGLVSLSIRLSDQLRYSPAKIADITRRMLNTNYKRNWPSVINRSEMGLPDIDNMRI